MGIRNRAAAAIATLVLACTGAHAGPAEDAQAAFSQFFKLFAARNQAPVAALSAPDAQFYGTNSSELVTTPDGVLRYFTSTLVTLDTVQARPIGVTATARSDNVVLLAGSWVSDRTVDGKLNSSGPLRMTAVMQKRGDQWTVVQFHNSRQPAPPATASQAPASR